MTNKLEVALEEAGKVFIEMAQEIKNLRAEIADLQIIVNKHETLNGELRNVFSKWS